MDSMALGGLRAYDPSGIDQMTRARERRFKYQVGNPNAPIGPLPDPRWEGYFQAVEDATGGRRARFGYWDQPQADITRDPTWAASSAQEMPQAMTAFPKSNQLGTPIDGLRRAYRR